MLRRAKFSSPLISANTVCTGIFAGIVPVHLCEVRVHMGCCRGGDGNRAPHPAARPCSHARVRTARQRCSRATTTPANAPARAQVRFCYWARRSRIRLPWGHLSPAPMPPRTHRKGGYGHGTTTPPPVRSSDPLPPAAGTPAAAAPLRVRLLTPLPCRDF